MKNETFQAGEILWLTIPKLTRGNQMRVNYRGRLTADSSTVSPRKGGRGFDVQTANLSRSPATGRVQLLPLEEWRGRRFLVKIDGAEAGTIAKNRNTTTETYPWQAWVFVGKVDAPEQPDGWLYDDRFLGSWFVGEEGGKAAAVDAVVRARAEATD